MFYLSWVDTNWELWNIWLVDDMELLGVELSRSNLGEDTLDFISGSAIGNSHHEDTSDFWNLVGAEKRGDVEFLGSADTHHEGGNFWGELLVGEDPLDHVVLVG